MSADVEVTFWLAPQLRDAFTSERAAALGAQAIGARSYLSRAELRRTGDASPAAFTALEARLAEAGVTHVERAWRRIRARGSRAACTRAAHAVRASTCGRAVVAMFGLDETPAPESYAHASAGRPESGVAPLDVARAYGLPAGLNGSGITVAILHFTGTYRAADLERAQASSHLPVPQVATRGGGAHSTREDDYEIALDTQVAAALAPASRLVLYRGDNDAGGYADAFAAALLDAQHAPSVISISYGVPEASWPPEAIELLEQLFIAAALCGVTVVAASGDRGSDAAHGEPRVVYPASSAYALACGGTKLRLEGSRRVSEVVWNEAGRASGGGYSRRFERARWQTALAHARGRAVPDVAGHAATANGYRVCLGDDVVLIGGTSAVAPLWAGFIALMNERLGRPCGLFTPLLYARANAELFYDVKTGSNGRYEARAGWDACTGFGSPDFGALLRFFADAA